MGRQENLFLELEIGHARIAAGYGTDDSDSEEEAFLERRKHAIDSFPLRDIHCEFEMTLAARVRAENATRRRRRTLSDYQRLVETGDMDAQSVRHDCQNCGTHVMVIAFTRSSRPIHGNFHMMCMKCNGTMCMTCANKGVDSMVPICYPCQFRWQRTWVTVKSTWRNNDGRATTATDPQDLPAV